MPPLFLDPDLIPWQPGHLFLGISGSGAEVGLKPERGAITIAGSRAGKGAAYIIPNLLRWPHSALVIDPKGENAAATWKARAEIGPVHVLDPFGIADVPAELRASCNLLDGISGLTMREDIRVIADGLVIRRDSRDGFWDDGAQSVIAGLVAHGLNTATSGVTPSLPAMRGLLRQSGAALDAVFEAMAAAPANDGGLAAGAASTALGDARSAAEFIGGAKAHTEWLDSPAMAAMLSSSGFSLSALKNGRCTVYLVIPPHYIAEHARFLRLFTLAALNEMARGGLAGEPCLFLLDEFFSLGRLDLIVKSAGLMPGYGVRLWPFLQDIGQLRQLYGKDGAATFFANSDAAIFFGNSDRETLEFVSDRLGRFTTTDMPTPPPLKRYWGKWQHGLFEDAAGAQSRIHTINQMRVETYRHSMSQLGQPRLPPETIASLTGKGGAEPVAASAIVFGPLGSAFNLRLAPYFLPRPGALPEPPRRNRHTGSWPRAIVALFVLWVAAALLHDLWVGRQPRQAARPTREVTRNDGRTVGARNYPPQRLDMHRGAVHEPQMRPPVALPMGNSPEIRARNRYRPAEKPGARH